MTGIPEITPYRMPTDADLPRNHAGWRVDPDRAVLLVHDMQRYFVRVLPDRPRTTLLARCGELRAHAAAAGVPVVYTAQPGDMSVEQRGLLRDFWGPGMRGRPEDREIVSEVSPADGDRTFTKWRYSAFARSGLLAHLRRLGRDQIVVCGVYAHVGVLATALDAFTHDIEPFLVADAVADFSAARHRLTLSYAAERCAVVRSTAAVLVDLATADRPREVAS